MSEVRRLDSKIKQLLKDLGELQWGTTYLLFPNYDVEMTVSELRCCWRLRNIASGYGISSVPMFFWDVVLVMEETDFWFVVSSRGGQRKTADTSEDELKNALRWAAESGPIAWE